MKISKGAVLELTIDDLAYGAQGVARVDDYVVFVDRAIPGQKVKAKIKQKKRSYAEGYVLEVVEPSPSQIDPPCPYFGVCGGCKLQHMQYREQLRHKTKQVKELLERIGGFENPDILPTLPAKDIYNYRNKMEFSFSDQRWLREEDEEKPHDFALGLHVPRRFDKVLNVDACLLQCDTANAILKDVTSLTLETGLKPYGVHSHEGFWRFFIIREGKNTGELMLNFITSGQEGQRGNDAVDWVVHKLFWRFPEITSVIHSVTDKVAQVAFSESERLLLGPPVINEKVGHRTYEISPNAFFQTNTRQTEVLFDTIVNLAKFQCHEIVYDLYCGTGAIGIYIADYVKKVVGIEVIEAAVKDGQRNIELNQLTNIELILADMKDALKETEAIIAQHGHPDVIILDPPRGGTHPDTIKHVIGLSPAKIVYVSCNPSILARDAAVLCENVYRMETVQPVDMFPHTGHVEVVTLFTKT